MSLDANKPTDQILVSEIASYIRANRVAINAVSGSGNVGVTVLEVALGVTSLVIGTDIGTYGFEIVKISGAAAVVLATMTGGTEGMVKVFVFQDANIDITDGVKADGKFYLNHLPALSDYVPQQDDVLALVNIGGDGASVHGYWKELYRTTSVK